MAAITDEDAEARKVGKARRARQAELRANAKLAVQGLLKTSQGRDYLRWLLWVGKVDQQPYRSHRTDTYFSCGELNVGLQIKAQLIEADPHGYLELLKEMIPNVTAPDTSTDSGPAAEPDSDASPNADAEPIEYS